ncbi:MAG: hypothetical protein Q8Q91_02230 [Candidatus Daviesbacteria bacterium]|nr:hypothetical protein [Candidatus Daviesbacteria bacterium]
MKISKNSAQDKTMIRLCAICSAEILVHRLPNRRYKGGNYFGRIGAGKEKFEYWECDKCYKE